MRGNADHGMATCGPHFEAVLRCVIMDILCPYQTAARHSNSCLVVQPYDTLL